MAISMYHGSVPVFLQLLGGLKGVIEKAEAHATAHKWDESTVLNLRLYPDMFTLARQVRQASEHAFGAGRAAVPEGLEGRSARRQRGRAGYDHGRRPAPQFPRPELPLSLRDAEFLFPYDYGVQRSPQSRDRDRQARLYGPDAVIEFRHTSSHRRGAGVHVRHGSRLFAGTPVNTQMGKGAVAGGSGLYMGTAALSERDYVERPDWSSTRSAPW